MEEEWSDKQQDQNNKKDYNNTAKLWTVKSQKKLQAC